MKHPKKFQKNIKGPKSHCPFKQEFNTNEQSTNDNYNGNTSFGNDNNNLNDDVLTIFIKSNNQENTSHPENTGENDHNHGNINYSKSNTYESDNNNKGSSSNHHSCHYGYHPRTNKSIRNQSVIIPNHKVTQEQATQDEVTQDDAKIFEMMHPSKILKMHLFKMTQLFKMVHLPKNQIK
ncbi:hypothetical protein RclHR1_05610001 [Rhizophagus clarus]|uniref:Uncharacterized protein n=1 Tax=Rhizophagus clarus TaxID=94130 RepID=A0A2Z6RP84_9GLOM|nr:hypothetical protein RclHR1_05610001 [Rhizophagus clarus]